MEEQQQQERHSSPPQERESPQTTTHPSRRSMRVDSIEYERHRNVKVVFGDARVIPSFPKNYVRYVITLKARNGRIWYIERRYKQFQQLNKKLTQEFIRKNKTAGAEITKLPTLPKPAKVGRLKPDFIEQRKRALTHFLQGVLDSPTMFESKILRKFIELPNDWDISRGQDESKLEVTDVIQLLRQQSDGIVEQNNVP